MNEEIVIDPAEKFARRLSDKARRAGSGWITLCPTHDDHEPSLILTTKPGKPMGIIGQCLTGCEWKTVEAMLKRLEEAPKRAGIYNIEQTQ